MSAESNAARADEIGGAAFANSKPIPKACGVAGAVFPTRPSARYLYAGVIQVEGVWSMIVADYIVVGAGSAGCVLASRLTEDGRTRVLLLEAGGDDRPTRNLKQFASNLAIHLPVGFVRTINDPKVNWLFEPVPNTKGRTHIWPRGRVLGGSSSINGLVYVRGQRQDYDGWRQLGCEGWSYESVLPYFRRSQHQERGECETHGVDGPLNISDPTISHPVSTAALKACEALGLPNRDFNGHEQEGADWFQGTMKNGRRCSASVAYLHPAMARPNLQVETDALATRILFDGKRAIGVEFRQGGQRHLGHANAEVILAGGAINSPQLLQLSGIGPAGLLREHDVNVVADLPGVGENLQDHYGVRAVYRLKRGTISFNERRRGWRAVVEALHYLIRRKGLLTQPAAHVGIFCKSRPELASPDIQFHFLPGNRAESGSTALAKLDGLPGCTLFMCQLRPESRGRIRIKSSDPRIHPSIAPNYLADPLDRQVVVAGLRWARRIAAQAPLADHIDHELAPGEQITSDEELLAYASDQGQTLYHPVGTCAMGHGPNAVVDPHLRVHGLTNLRVVDASIMPRLVSGNTNAPTIMIAEKASDMIRSDAARQRIAS